MVGGDLETCGQNNGGVRRPSPSEGIDCSMMGLCAFSGSDPETFGRGTAG